MLDHVASDKASINKWAAPLREARLKLQADYELVKAQLKKIPCMDKVEITSSLLQTSTPYLQAVSDFEVYSDLEEDSFFFRRYYKFLADRAEKRMEDISQKIFESIEAKREFGQTYYNNKQYEAKAAEANKIAGNIAEIKYYESKLESGKFSEKEFEEIWERKSIHNKLNAWQHMVIQPVFDPKFNKKRPTPEAKSINDIHWMSVSTKSYYGISQVSNEEFKKARP